MSPFKDFKLAYEAPNEEDTFSSGDSVIGTATFSLPEETKVKSVRVKAKGFAHVHWSEGSGDNRRTHSATKTYFKLKEFLLAETDDGTVLPRGVHQFKFRFELPQMDMPSSFKGDCGKIVYELKAKISKKWRMDSVVKKEFKFVSKSLVGHAQIKCPLSDSVAKDVGVFSKGHIQMSATVDRKVCSPGDTLFVVANVCNSCSKTMKPKFSLNQKIVYRAGGSTTSRSLSVAKVVGNPILQNSYETASCQVKIPDDVICSLQNCEIISVEYCLKVYLDISFARDPEVVFPLVVVPRSFATLYPREAVGPYPAGAAGAQSYSDFPPPGSLMGTYPGPAAYKYPASDPTQQANTANGNYSQWPQQVPPYGFPPAAFPSSSWQQ